MIAFSFLIPNSLDSLFLIVFGKQQRVWESQRLTTSGDQKTVPLSKSSVCGLRGQPRRGGRSLLAGAMGQALRRSTWALSTRRPHPHPHTKFLPAPLKLTLGSKLGAQIRKICGSLELLRAVFCSFRHRRKSPLSSSPGNALSTVAGLCISKTVMQ